MESTDKKIPCYVLIYFDYETTKKSLDFLVRYSSRLDIMVIENYNEYTHKQIRPYVADLLNQGKIIKYFLFDENIGFNAVEAVMKHEREELLEKHDYFILTDGDFTTHDALWMNERLSLMENPKLISSDIHPGMANLKSTEASKNNYLDGQTGWTFTILETKNFFSMLDKAKSQEIKLSDEKVYQIAKHFNLK